MPSNLTLRQATINDANFVYEMMQDKEFQKHYLERLIFDTVEKAQKDIKQNIRGAKRGLSYAFIVKLKKEKVGILWIYKINKQDRKASIGYGISAKYWGKGYGTQVCKKGIDFAKKDLQLHSLEAATDPNNYASKRVLEKNGFIKIGTAKDYYFDRGKFTDRDLYWKIL